MNSAVALLIVVFAMLLFSGQLVVLSTFARKENVSPDHLQNRSWIDAVFHADSFIKPKYLRLWRVSAWGSIASGLCFPIALFFFLSDQLVAVAP